MRKKLNVLTFILFLISISQFVSANEERVKLFKEATAKLKKMQIEKLAPQKGEQFPEITFSNKKLSEHLKKGPILLIVYRGGWCPYCMAQLKEIQTNLKYFENYKVQVVAISPDTTQKSLTSKRKFNFSFDVVADENHNLLRKMNLVYKVDSKVLQEYQKLGINLEGFQGNNKGELPVPATYLIGTNGKIIYSYVDADYTKRPSLADLKEIFPIKE
jgi:peroxiredoxin